MKKEKLSKLQKEIIDKSTKNLNKKQLTRLEEQKKKLNIISVNHAIYKTNKEKIEAPFGKAFKTGSHNSKKDFNRSKEKFSKNKEY